MYFCFQRADALVFICIYGTLRRDGPALERIEFFLAVATFSKSPVRYFGQQETRR